MNKRRKTKQCAATIPVVVVGIIAGLVLIADDAQNEMGMCDFVAIKAIAAAVLIGCFAVGGWLRSKGLLLKCFE